MKGWGRVAFLLLVVSGGAHARYGRYRRAPWYWYRRHGGDRRLRSQAFYESRGISFPPGAAVTFDERTGNLSFTNTEANLREIERLLQRPPLAPDTPDHIETSVVLVSMPRGLASACGLLPGAQASSMSRPDVAVVREAVAAWRAEWPADRALGTVRAVLRAEDARRAMVGLRGMPGVQILGSGRTLGLAGCTVVARDVVERVLEPDEGTEQLGLSLDTTADVDRLGHLVLEFRISWSVLMELPEAMRGVWVHPAVSEIDMEGEYLLDSGTQVIVQCPGPTLRADGDLSPLQEQHHDAFWQDRTLFAFVSVVVVPPAVAAEG